VRKARGQLPEALILWILQARRQLEVQKSSTTPWLFLASNMSDSGVIVSHMQQA